MILPILSELLGRKVVVQVASPKPEAIRRFMKFIGDEKTALIAHNAAFDLRTLHQCIDAILKQVIRCNMLQAEIDVLAMRPAFEAWGLHVHECMKLLVIGSNAACYCLWTSGWATSDVFRHSWLHWSCQPIQSFSVMFTCFSITVWTQTIYKFAPSSGQLWSVH